MDETFEPNGTESLSSNPLDPELREPFTIVEPAALLTPLVFSSPHSGCVYPRRLLQMSQLDSAMLRRSEDAYVDALFALAPKCGAPLLKANFPRAYLDLNREPYELDPRMFDGQMPAFVNSRSLRVAAGLGTVPRLVADAREIYGRKLPAAEAFARVDQLYKPYHEALRGLMTRAHETFGVAVLIDCHSMPMIHAARIGAASKSQKPVADFVIGDRYGASCAARLVETIEESLRSFGHSVQRNKPYAGGFITEHYGKPAAGWHAAQIEIARALYMDEASLQKKELFDTLVAQIGDLVRALSQAVLAPDFAAPCGRAAAE